VRCRHIGRAWQPQTRQPHAVPGKGDCAEEIIGDCHGTEAKQQCHYHWVEWLRDTQPGCAEHKYAAGEEPRPSSSSESAGLALGANHLQRNLWRHKPGIDRSSNCL
jgi:hypothetical protein